MPDKTCMVLLLELITYICLRELNRKGR